MLASKFEKIYQSYASELQGPIHIQERLAITKKAREQLNHSNRFVSRSIGQYLNDRSLDNLPPNEAWEHTMKICRRAAGYVQKTS